MTKELSSILVYHVIISKFNSNSDIFIRNIILIVAKILNNFIYILIVAKILNNFIYYNIIII